MTLITTREEFYIPLFLKYGDFGPLNASRASLAVCKRNTFLLVILVPHVYNIILDPLAGLIHSNPLQVKVGTAGLLNAAASDDVF